MININIGVIASLVGILGVLVPAIVMISRISTKTTVALVNINNNLREQSTALAELKGYKLDIDQNKKAIQTLDKEISLMKLKCDMEHERGDE